MQFDNAAFETKLAGTIASIEKLNSTLAHAGSVNGLSNISAASQNFHLGGIHAAIDGVSAKFLAMSTIAVTVLSNIVSHALTAGAQIAKALFFQPELDGFSEYELKIGSIQTVLANTSADGTTLGQVNDALNQLNEYSDKTIYNFGQMTKNIGTFSAAGVDLDTSVMAIKGIANVAAISGSNSEQASMAMYQLSQAVANGSVKLMDWNSVVNAGMGGEVFQKALFETGKMMGTIADTPMDMTFEEWTAAGNSFRGSLEEGWLTADVLTTTLSGFTGDMTEAQLTALGYTEAQAAEMYRLGQLGVDSATKVRTLTQLINTSKEALQSGWARSFEIIFGDFKEATELFTGISDAISGMIGKNAEARNSMLQLWKDMSGRDKLIQGIKDGFIALGEILAPIKEAFRDVFGQLNAGDLYRITKQFADLMAAMRPSEQTVENLKRIFTGFFSVLSIGWNVLKEGVGFIKDLIVSFTGLGSGGFLEGLADISDFFTRLRETLVDGGGISTFFDNLASSLQKPIKFIKDLKTKLLDLFDSIKLPEGLSDIFGSIGSLFGSLGDSLSGAGSGVGGAAGGIWAGLKSALGGIDDILSGVWDSLADFFGNLGSNLAAIISAPDFDSVLAVIDTALLGGIAAILYKIFSGGLFSGFGDGIFKNISGAFGELTGTLRAMQTDLKAHALLNIAIAVGILAASLFVLSTIPAEKITDAMTSLTTAFGLLIGAFAILNKMSINLVGAGTFALIASGMVIMAGAVLLLVGAIKLLSMMEWDELARGLTGVAGALGLLVGATLLLNFAKGSIIGAGVGMLFMAGALVIMAAAVKLFSMMDWDEIVQGLVGVAGALVAIALGVKFIGPSILLIGPGLIAVGIALGIIAGAMKIMASLGWEEIGKGLTVIGGALGLIAAATYFMSPFLPLVGVGLIAVSIGLTSIAGVIAILGALSWGSIVKGLVALGGALLVIGLFTTFASGGILGAAGLIAMAFGLTMLVGVLTTMAAMSWGSIIKGVGGIAVALAVLAGVAYLLTPAVVPLLGIGLALTLLGAGFALFGVGVISVAKGIETLVKVGPKGIEALMDAIAAFGEALPALFRDVGDAIIEFLDTLLTGMPDIVEKLVQILGKILDGLVELIPKAADAIGTLIGELLRVIRGYFPDLVQTGFEIIIALLTGIRDNIGEIVTLAADIIIRFLDALAEKIPEIIDALFNFFGAVIGGVAAKSGELGEKALPIAAGMISGLLSGLSAAIPAVIDWFKGLPGMILGGIGDIASLFLDIGGNIITGLKDGAIAAWNAAVSWFQDLPQLIRTAIGRLLDLLSDIGENVINGLKNGATAAWDIVVNWFKSIPQLIRTAIGRLLDLLSDIGENVINGLKNGAKAAWDVVVGWFQSIPQLIRTAIGGLRELLTDIGGNVINGLKNGATDAWDAAVGWFQSIPQLIRTAIGGLRELLTDIGANAISSLRDGMTGAWHHVSGWVGDRGQAIRTAIGSLRGLLTDIGGNIIQSLSDGITNKWDSVKGTLGSIGNAAKNIFKSVLGIGSPSKVFTQYGEWIMEGLQIGLDREWENVETWLNNVDPANAMKNNLTERMSEVVAGMASQLEDMDEFHPTITPVLDLTQIQAGAKALASMIPSTASYLQAADISRRLRPGAEETTADITGQGDVKFEQNIYAPKQLSTGDIYRQTRNQIMLAKEELKIP
jgi:tape measure domain-containing protein